MEVSGELGKEDGGRDSPSLWVDTAALLHVDMEEAAPSSVLDLKEVDMDLEAPDAGGLLGHREGGEAEPADTVVGDMGITLMDGNGTGGALLGSKAYLKSTVAIDSFNSPNQVSTKTPSTMVPIVLAL